MDKTRIDKWLWAARFFKTRSLAVEAINKGRIRLNQQTVKPARDVKVGDEISILKQAPATVITVQAISNVRGPAAVAQTLYTETADSIAAREHATEMHRLAPEPAHSHSDGRPTKRDRRKIQRFTEL